MSAPARVQPAGEVAPDEYPVVVGESGAGRFTQTVHAGRHVMTADEPAGVGDDTGPNPYDLLLAALGSCTSMTLRMYADKRGWPLQRVAVRLRHDRQHVQDCQDADRRRCMVDRIDRQLELTGPLSAEQRAQLLRIAERCPVHRTLTGEIHIATTLG